MNTSILAETLTTLSQHDKELVAASSIVTTFLTFSIIIGITIGILFIVAWWKIFKKAGLKGWKSIIPFYNQYCLFRISGMSGWWCLFPFIPSLCFSFAGFNPSGGETAIGDAQTNNPLFWLGLIFTIAEIVIAIVQVVKLAEGFKKGTGFKVASVFFPNITSLILAFGKAKYDKKFLHD